MNSTGPKFNFDLNKLDELKEDDYKTYDSDDEEAMERKRVNEEQAMLENEASAALALIKEEERLEAEREAMEDRKKMESLTPHEMALNYVKSGVYTEGVELLLGLLEIYEKNKTIRREKDRKTLPNGTPSEDIMIREIAEVYILMAEYAPASLLIGKFFTKFPSFS